MSLVQKEDIYVTHSINQFTIINFTLGKFKKAQCVADAKLLVGLEHQVFD